MMSERFAVLVREQELVVQWTDIWKVVPELLEETDPSDVRWEHVQKMKKYYEQMLSKFETKKQMIHDNKELNNELEREDNQGSIRNSN